MVAWKCCIFANDKTGQQDNDKEFLHTGRTDGDR